METIQVTMSMLEFYETRSSGFYTKVGLPLLKRVMNLSETGLDRYYERIPNEYMSRLKGKCPNKTTQVIVAMALACKKDYIESINEYLELTKKNIKKVEDSLMAVSKL